jgi:integrase/recombinase XerD
MPLKKYSLYPQARLYPLSKFEFGIAAIDRSMVHLIIKEAALKTNLDPGISCHWLRHAHAQHSLTKGAPIHLVRDTLGHSNISVTNVYLESNPEDSSSKYLGL